MPGTEHRGDLRILATCFDFRPGLGGIATVGEKLMRALDGREGTTVRLLAPARPGAEAFDDAAGLDIKRVRMGRTPTASILPFARAVRREIKDWAPSLVLNLLWLPDGTATRLATLGTGVPYYVFAHGVEVLESGRSARKRMRRHLSPVKRAVFCGARQAFAVSNFTASKLEEFGVPHERITLVYGGADPIEFVPGTRSEKLVARHGLAGKQVLLTVTRLHPYKGVDRALEALASVVRDRPDTCYVVVGSGPDRPRLEAIAQGLGLERHVVFAGAVPQAELREYYNLADAFMLLPREESEIPDAEGFGLVFLEAACCGKPSIAGRSGGVPDAVGDTGWLVDPDDPRAIEAIMRTVLEDDSERLRQGEAARLRAVEQLTWSAMAERILDAVGESPNQAVVRKRSGPGSAAAHARR